MRKVFISVFECEPGMIMAETIFNEYGAVIVAENSILDVHLIKKLDNLGFLKVKVFEKTTNIVSADNTEIFQAQYRENVDAIKNVLHEISVGHKIDIEAVNNISDSIFDRINENRDIIKCLNQIRSVDEYTYTHCLNVSLLSMLIGKWLKYDEQRIKQLLQSGLLHDIGKSKIAVDIINKPGKLTIDEFEEMKKHPLIGYRALENTENISKDVCMGVLMHHERSDGSGYPIGLKGDKIHGYAKIIALADIYDAMTSSRAYKERESPFEVFEMMENHSFGILDTRALNAFLSNIASYYIGDFVKLNTNDVAEVVYINPRNVSRPLLRIENKYIDLAFEPSIKIQKLI